MLPNEEDEDEDKATEVTQTEFRNLISALMPPKDSSAMSVHDKVTEYLEKISSKVEKGVEEEGEEDKKPGNGEMKDHESIVSIEHLSERKWNSSEPNTLIQFEPSLQFTSLGQQSNPEPSVRFNSASGITSNALFLASPKVCPFILGLGKSSYSVVGSEIQDEACPSLVSGAECSLPDLPPSSKAHTVASSSLKTARSNHRGQRLQRLQRDSGGHKIEENRERMNVDGENNLDDYEQRRLELVSRRR